MKRKGIGGSFVLLVIGTVFCLWGCSTTELEERSFPMLVAIGYEDGKLMYRDAFPQEDSFGSLGAKEKDYNHLKVLVLETDLLESESLYETVLKELAEEEKYPRNTYVCAMEDVEDLFEMGKDISQDLGTYLEEYLKLQEKNKDRLLSLGDLLDEQANKTIVLYLPYMDVEDNKIIWKGYVNTSGKTWKDSK